MGQNVQPEGRTRLYRRTETTQLRVDGEEQEVWRRPRTAGTTRRGGQPSRTLRATETNLLESLRIKLRASTDNLLPKTERPDLRGVSVSGKDRNGRYKNLTFLVIIHFRIDPSFNDYRKNTDGKDTFRTGKSGPRIDSIQLNLFYSLSLHQYHSCRYLHVWMF